MGLVDGVENVRIASVILVLQAILLQVEGHVVNVRHEESNLVNGWGDLQASAGHLMQSLLNGSAVHALVSRTGESLDQGRLHISIDLDAHARLISQTNGQSLETVESTLLKLTDPRRTCSELYTHSQSAEVPSNLSVASGNDVKRQRGNPTNPLWVVFKMSRDLKPDLTQTEVTVPLLPPTETSVKGT